MRTNSRGINANQWTERSIGPIWNKRKFLIKSKQTLESDNSSSHCSKERICNRISFKISMSDSIIDNYEFSCFSGVSCRRNKYQFG